jgi:hypothetical protein
MTLTTDRDTSRRLEELDERTRRAWATYRDALQDKTGRDYDEAETEAWADLQLRLQEVGQERAEIAGPADPRTGEA